METTLYFTATWCQPCKIFGPIMEKLKEDLNVHKIDIEEEMDVAARYGVLSVPTVVFVRDDGPSITELGRFVGVRTEDWVRDFHNELGE